MSTGPDEDEREAQLEDPVEERDQEEGADPGPTDDDGDDESAGLSEAPTGP